MHERAREHGLDLVGIAPSSEPPVCKILDYSREIPMQVRLAAKAEPDPSRGSPLKGDVECEVKKGRLLKKGHASRPCSIRQMKREQGVLT